MTDRMVAKISARANQAATAGVGSNSRRGSPSAEIRIKSLVVWEAREAR